MYEIICRLEIGADDIIPLLLVHPHHKPILCDAGVIHQYIYPAECVLYIIYGLVCHSKIGCI